MLTSSGQSGSIVLRNDMKTSIGAHVYGGGDKNKASPILGKYGNLYAVYVSVFDKNYPVATTKQKFDFIKVLLGLPTPDGGPGAEGFLDVLKSVASFAAPITDGVLSTVAPAFDPIGGPIAGLAGTLLNSINSRAESAVVDGSTESAFDESAVSPEDVQVRASRAIVGEAALQALLQKDPQALAGMDILDTMKKVYKACHPLSKKWRRSSCI